MSIFFQSRIVGIHLHDCSFFLEYFVYPSNITCDKVSKILFILWINFNFINKHPLNNEIDYIIIQSLRHRF